MFDNRHSFTKIRKNKEASTSGERIMQQLASTRNRRLAQQMERRPSVAAALRKDSIKSRLGLPAAISVRERLRYPRAFTARRGRGNLTGKSPLTRGLGRLNAMDVDTNMSVRRARSPYIVANKIAQRRSRSRSRSRGPIRSRSRSRGRSISRPRYRARSRSKSRSRFGGSMLSLRGQFSGRRTNFRRGRGIGLKTSRNDLKSYKPKLSGGFRGGNRRRGGNFRRGRGRGRGGGRNITVGRGRGRGNYQNRRIPTKEELDRELDQYMSTTKASLDKELDDMMNDEKWN
ncbi:hypothetical protein PGB90_000286 [Kerria lacca]